MSKVRTWTIRGLTPNRSTPGMKGKSWIASMVSPANEAIMVQGLLTASQWDAAAVRLGAIVRVEQKVSKAGKPYYQVVGAKRAAALAEEERREQRMAALEDRVKELEMKLEMLRLHDRTEAAERKAGGHPEQRHPPLTPQERKAREDYCRELANPDREFQMVPLAAAGA